MLARQETVIADVVMGEHDSFGETGRDRSVLPVSYTHLDVYKRQTLFGVDGELLERQYRNHLSGYLKGESLPHAGDWLLFEKNIGAVSYTHLIDRIMNEVHKLTVHNYIQNEEIKESKYRYIDELITLSLIHIFPV